MILGEWLYLAVTRKRLWGNQTRTMNAFMGWYRRLEMDCKCLGGGMSISILFWFLSSSFSKYRIIFYLNRSFNETLKLEEQSSSFHNLTFNVQCFRQLLCHSPNAFCSTFFSFVFQKKTLVRPSLAWNIFEFLGFLKSADVSITFLGFTLRHQQTKSEEKEKEGERSEAFFTFSNHLSFLFGYAILHQTSSSDNNNSLQSGLFCKKNFYLFVCVNAIQFPFCLYTFSPI